MKTFTEFLLEAKHHAAEKGETGDWGVIHRDGRMISGAGHETATTHNDLLDSVNVDEGGEEGEDPAATFTHFKDDDTLHLRSDGKEGAKLLASRWSHLPKARTVYHDHENETGKPTYTQGNAARVLTKIHALSN